MAKLSDMAKLYGNKAPYCWAVYSALKKRKSKKDGKTRRTAVQQRKNVELVLTLFIWLSTFQKKKGILAELAQEILREILMKF